MGFDDSSPSRGWLEIIWNYIDNTSLAGFIAWAILIACVIYVLRISGISLLGALKHFWLSCFYSSPVLTILVSFVITGVLAWKFVF